jgi:hypothetical protein
MKEADRNSANRGEVPGKDATSVQRSQARAQAVTEVLNAAKAFHDNPHFYVAFFDCVGSTALKNDNEGIGCHLIEKHNEAMERALIASGVTSDARVWKFLGDGILVSFERIADCLVVAAHFLELVGRIQRTLSASKWELATKVASCLRKGFSERDPRGSKRMEASTIQRRDFHTSGRSRATPRPWSVPSAICMAVSVLATIAG